jgi:hypothetical protein
MDFNTGNIVTIVIVAAYAMVLVFYLKAEAANDGPEGFRKATRLKLTLGGMFIAVSIISEYLLYNYTVLGLNYIYMQGAVIAALVSAFFGDYFLQYIKLDVKKFKIGISFFTATQIVLIAMMYLSHLSYIGAAEFVITVVALLLVLLLMKKQNWKLGEESKRLTVYTILLVFMASKAVTVFFKDLSVGTLLFAIGAVLFLLSDMLLGIWNYNSGARKYANLSWITYFAGMMLIALSVSPEFSHYLAY